MQIDHEAFKRAADRAREGAVVMIKHTVDGAIPIRTIAGQKVESPQPECDILEEVGLPTIEKDMMAVVYEAIKSIKKSRRAIPLTRNELLFPKIKGGCTDIGFNKKYLRSLCNKGFLHNTEISLVNKEGKGVGVRSIVYFTVLGRAYIRKYIDEKYYPPWHIEKEVDPSLPETTSQEQGSE